MSKVSRIPLRGDIWDRIFDLFVDTSSSFKDKKTLSFFINDLYSPTEKIMLSKRLAAAVLLAKGHDYKSIGRVLRISDPTIAKISIKIKYTDGGLKKAVEKILAKQSSQIFWKGIEDLFDLPIKGNLKSPERFVRKIKRNQEISKIKNEF
jgi:uncharacterized protein YerC